MVLRGTVPPPHISGPRDGYPPLLSFVSPWTGSCRDARTQWGYQSDHQHSQIYTMRMMPFCSPTVNPSGRIYYHTSTPLHKHLDYTRHGRKPRFKTSAMDQRHHQLTYKGSRSKSRTNSQLGSAISSSGRSAPEIHRRIGLASSIMSQFANIWRQERLCLSTKLRLYNAFVVSVLHGAETWTLLKSEEQKLEAFNMSCQQRTHW